MKNKRLIVAYLATTLFLLALNIGMFFMFSHYAEALKSFTSWWFYVSQMIIYNDQFFVWKIPLISFETLFYFSLDIVKQRATEMTQNMPSAESLQDFLVTIKKFNTGFGLFFFYNLSYLCMWWIYLYVSLQTSNVICNINLI